MGRGARKSLQRNKKVLTNAPALDLPEMMKTFLLYEGERLETTIGVLTQLLGSWHHWVAYLSKQLDAVSRGWLLCLLTLVATAALVAEADKLTLG
jgi:hypothetical protein